MSRKANDWAWKTSAKGSGRLVLLALADFADANGWAWAQLPALAERAGVGEATVKRQIPRLEEMGLLSVTRRRGRGVSLIFLVLHPGHDTRDAKTAHPELFKTDRSTAPETDSDPSNTAHRELLNGHKTAHPENKTAHSVVKNSSFCSSAPYIGTSNEPVSEPRASQPPMAFDTEPTVANVQRADALVREHLPTQPRPTLNDLTRTVAGCLRDGIGEPVIVAGLLRWRTNGHRAVSLADFIAEQIRRAPESPTNGLNPDDHLRALWKAGNAVEVARLVQVPWVDPSKAPSDPTPLEDFLRKARRQFIELHRDDAIRTLSDAEARRSA